MEPFTTLDAVAIPIDQPNLDTDQIIPARFLKTISKAGLGQNLFADWRYDDAGQPIAGFPLNRPENQGARILLAGDHFITIEALTAAFEKHLPDAELSSLLSGFPEEPFRIGLWVGGSSTPNSSPP